MVDGGEDPCVDEGVLMLVAVVVGPGGPGVLAACAIAKAVERIHLPKPCPSLFNRPRARANYLKKLNEKRLL